MKTWEELRRGIYHVDGSYRDVYVLNANREDWDKWIAFVNSHYPIRWEAEGLNDKNPSDTIGASFIVQRWDMGMEQLTVIARVFLKQVQVNCHFFIDTEIENDIDPKEVQSIEDHERILAYLIGISTTLGKEVILTEENTEEAVLIRVNGSSIQLTY